ncbi:MAG: hypothetical protein IPJ81_03595 [Chitinophagaceae bacterium]|nr:hypothetical protein [Chitinophagaceae bacterium]
MAATTLNSSIQHDFDLPVKETLTLQELQELLSGYINELIQNDFNRLVFLLYKIDVSEIKLKHILKDSSVENAGKIIANLIIERQQQKIISRKNSAKEENPFGEEEKW